MADMEALFRAVDDLTPAELNQLHNYVEQRRRVTWWVVPPENLRKIDDLMRPVQQEAAQMPDEEVNRIIDEAITEVRHERKQNQGRN